MYRRHHQHRLMLDTDPGAPTENGSGRRGPLTSEVNFDANMVIILAALLCALICALGLNSIVRCALRYSWRFAMESPNEAAASSSSSTGLRKSALRRIPVAEYGSGVNIPATDCPICLCEFAGGDKVRVLPKCHHGFHMRCIDVWLASHSSCPTCRQSLLEPPPEVAGGADVEGGIRHNFAVGGQGDVSGSAE